MTVIIEETKQLAKTQINVSVWGVWQNKVIKKSQRRLLKESDLIESSKGGEGRVTGRKNKICKGQKMRSLYVCGTEQWEAWQGTYSVREEVICKEVESTGLGD